MFALFLCHHRRFHERIVGQSQDFPENRKLCERKVQQGSRDKDRLTSASECILNKAFLFVYYIKNKEFIINPDDRMFFLFTTSPSIVDNKLRF